MNSYQRQFKDDIFSGIVDLINSIWQPILIGYVVYFAFSKLMTFGILRLLGFTSIEEFTESYTALMLDQEALLEWVQDLKTTVMQPEVLIYIIGGVIISFLVMSWSYYFSFKVAKHEINDGTVDVVTTFKESISGKLLGLIGLSIVIAIMIWAVFIIAIVFSTMVSPFLLVLFIPLTIFLGLKFFLAYPAYALGNYSIKEAIAYSFEHLTVVRTLKIVAIGFGVMMGIVIFSAVLQQIAHLVKSVPLTYIIVKSIFDFITGGFTLVIIVAALTGLYYRYETMIEEADEFSIDDHLIDDDY
ncbi:MAG: hypothetical protein KDD32_06530 [Bacteroidetes bacterium]|nr:hypothetical protein [Bacteroidota bacterium]